MSLFGIMKNLLTTKEIKNFKTDGAIVLRKKFDISWVEKLKIGIKKLDLLDWLEKEFGSVEKEIRDLNTTAPAAEFYWDKTLLDIFYGMRRSNNETYQFMTVTHKRYAQLFNKHREEEERK